MSKNIIFTIKSASSPGIYCLSSYEINSKQSVRQFKTNHCPP